jgi:predicted oxidoreductase
MSSPNSDVSNSHVTDSDVIVIGGGGAGLTAAIMAAENGADVLLFESEGSLGGSTKLSSGIFSTAGTSVQSALGIHDTAELLYQHYMDLNGWTLESGLIMAFCVESAPAFEWLLGLGVDVPAKRSYNARQPGLNQGGVSDVWRSHVPAGEGAAVVAVLERAVAASSIRVELNSQVERLLFEDGRVSGVVVGGREYRAPSVVLASGGLSHDRELLERYYPRAIASPELFEVAAPGSRGDHLRFGESIGASTAGEGRGLLLLAADFQKHHHWTAGFPPKSRIYVDQAGRRFTNEDVSYSVSTGVFDTVGGWAWSVFDENARLSLATDEFVDWTPEVVAREADAGVTTVRADTLDELADLMGVPVHALLRTVERWNGELPLGKPDSEFFRHRTFESKGVTENPAPVATGPFYAVRMRPSELICTHTGLAITGSAQVLDLNGDVIPGLYAAGEAGGGVLGESYVGGGNSVANALTMGRVAGRSAAARV